jgi:hypothetical protein
MRRRTFFNVSITYHVLQHSFNEISHRHCTYNLFKISHNTPLTQWARGCFPGGKTVGAWNWPVTSIWCQAYEWVEVHLCSPSIPSWSDQGRLLSSQHIILNASFHMRSAMIVTTHVTLLTCTISKKSLKPIPPTTTTSRDYKLIFWHHMWHDGIILS